MKRNLLAGLSVSASLIRLVAAAQIQGPVTPPAGGVTPPQANPGTSIGLQEVIVTATRRNENLQNVPVSVSAITSSQLTAKGVFNTADLNNSLPNLQVQSAYGETQPNFTLRGVGVGTEYNSNAASPVGVYVDEATSHSAPPRVSSSTTWIRWRWCVARRARSTAATPPAAPSTSSPASRD